jgi:H+/Cl- antiporter ClcA
VLEMTNRHTSVFAMMLAAAIAIGVAKIFDRKSLYEHLLELYISKNPTEEDKKQSNNLKK